MVFSVWLVWCLAKYHFQVDVAAAQAALGHQRSNDAFELAHVGVHRVGEVVHHVVRRNVDAVLLFATRIFFVVSCLLRASNPPSSTEAVVLGQGK